MSRTPSFAVVLEGGLVQAIVVQDWPRHLPMPPFVVVDYDTEGADDDEITRFSIGQSTAEAICRGDTPTVFESLSDALSPRIVLTALGESITDEAPEPLALARSVRQEIVDLDTRLNDAEQAPTGDDYNQLYVLANCGLIEVQKALGDTTDFGD
ncbi:TPA: hypothetical protein RVE07_000112 [Escherichia coli]|jgi:hypothetical protein|uniref:hypothetical protein n=1 Tax=Pseudomonadota TaxID=1224 RepID=UPI00089DC27F|nr:MULTISPECIES: hypothetical protein [Pseudomonadota]EFE7737401.1 hypothetical protein [Escherichia coli]EJA9920195.1 hypothetical protein [Pseudomonas aeruginosa]MBK3430822.1 hypothetical protein [Pseudomonas fluorescens]AUT46443.1 hypothetical protein C2U31_10860 [Achromobacter sp. AONIH1]AUY33101.1 hypothetical protein C3F42_07680 [Pseudomonas sp. PONIH3]